MGGTWGTGADGTSRYITKRSFLTLIFIHYLDSIANGALITIVNGALVIARRLQLAIGIRQTARGRKVYNGHPATSSKGKPD